jgi:hypothetical protein
VDDDNSARRAGLVFRNDWREWFGARSKNKGGNNEGSVSQVAAGHVPVLQKEGWSVSRGGFSAANLGSPNGA